MGKKGGGVRIKQVGPKGGGGMTPANMAQMMQNPMEAFMPPPVDPSEAVNLPPPPDRSYQIFWPIQETFSMDYRAERFRILYPSYIDGTKTAKQGRRLGLDKCVGSPPPTMNDNTENDPSNTNTSSSPSVLSDGTSGSSPTVSDMSLALQQLGVRHVIQPYRGYSRDVTCTWDNPGRIVYDATKFRNKRDAMERIASIVPTLPERHRRLEQERLIREQQLAEKRQYLLRQQQQPSEKQTKSSTSSSAAVATTSGGAAGTPSSSSTNKKKSSGKRGRRK